MPADPRVTMQLRLSAEDANLLRGWANSRGLTIQEYMYQAIFPHDLPNQAMKEELDKLDRIKQRPVTLAIDFDGVIHRYSLGWQDGTIYDPPNHGTKEALQGFIDHGYEVVIFTTRAFDRVVRDEFQKNQLEELKQWLNIHQIPYTRIAEEGKPLAHIYVDDRGFFFMDWMSAVPNIRRRIENLNLS